MLNSMDSQIIPDVVPFKATWVLKTQAALKLYQKIIWKKFNI